MKGQPIGGFALVAALVALAAPALSAGRAPALPSVGADLADLADLQCLPDQDVSCTLVRETPNGVLVWTERYQPAPSRTARWSLILEPGTRVSGDPVRVAPTDALASTPNGAPILE